MPVILLPGMLCDARVWQPQQQALAAAGYEVEVPAYSRFPGVAEVAAELLAAAPSRFALAGLSMGGILAFEMHRQAPERLTHLALLDTNPGPEDLERGRRRLEQVERALAGEFRAVFSREIAPSYLSRAADADPALIALTTEMAMSAGVGMFRDQVMALRARRDYRSSLPNIDCPSLVLCGEEDRLCPPSLHEDMAEQIPEATLQIVHGAGHLPGLEQPDAVNRALLTLLAVT